MSTANPQGVIKQAEDQMNKAIKHLEDNLTKVRAGKASPSMLDNILVDYYGAPTLIPQIANVNVLDAKTLAIQPWEKNMLAPIEKAILQANIGITPQSDGVQIRLYLPPLTEERRKELFKKAVQEGEQSKVVIRNVRRDALESIKKQQKEGLSEDISKNTEKSIQDLTNKFIAIIDKTLSAKEKEMMSV